MGIAQRICHAVMRMAMHAMPHMRWTEYQTPNVELQQILERSPGDHRIVAYVVNEATEAADAVRHDERDERQQPDMRRGADDGNSSGQNHRVHQECPQL